MSANENASIASIVYTPKTVERHPKDHFARQPLESAQLVANFGIEHDLKGGHPKRQLNVMCAEKLAALNAEGFKTAPGELGEQIIVKNLDIEALPSGTHVQIGSEAVIEIVELRNGCDRFESIQGKPRGDAAKRLGIIARVIQSGTIQVGDPVAVKVPHV